MSLCIIYIYIYNIYMYIYEYMNIYIYVYIASYSIISRPLQLGMLEFSCFSHITSLVSHSHILTSPYSHILYLIFTYSHSLTLISCIFYKKSPNPQITKFTNFTKIQNMNYTTYT